MSEKTFWAYIKVWSKAGKVPLATLRGEDNTIYHYSDPNLRFSIADQISEVYGVEWKPIDLKFMIYYSSEVYDEHPG